MKTYVVMSAVGRDRPGFVNRVMHAIRDLGGNVELQRSTRMADEFALIVLFSLPGADADTTAAIARLDALQADDMSVNARKALAPAGDRSPGTRTATLEATGADQPGIIEAVTLLLYKHHVNVETMEYDTEGAPFTGEHLFKMTAALALPEGTNVEALQTQLEELESQMNFDVRLEIA